ncbi:phosphopantetheine-binding protein [Actinokineospora auranticolor]|uniref:Bifunctional isochorismate lyase/aryl carrier protein n=1 Tax=Actinokineospora auranticolor TaxID=155976 RepID=A0A2S6GCQ1_9PSEU|nr:phosphopantetheine-binding protein [Actinokineospora auranticolor]PPK62590.1 bifunctional isochorismate lyase/aryl carrier protein [Actinokineospora auranticolor]
MTTTDQVRAQIAELLEIPASEIADDDNLLDHGLDSIRVMTLIETWRDHGTELAFADLAETPTVTAWTTLLQR